jgi:quercetin dioxygenase-like cupin family protein
MNPKRDRAEDRTLDDAKMLDLGEHLTGLMDRAIAAPHGRAQQTLYKHETTTVALFAFRPGAGLPEHLAPGTVTVQVVAGEVTMKAGSETFTLKSGRLLLIAPGVRHSVLAECDAAILVHITLSPASS